MGALTALTIVMKGLPLAYSKDMQEDKEPVFDAFDALEVGLAAMAGMIADHITGRVVALAESKDLTLDALSLADMQSIEPRITDDIYRVLSPLASASSRTSNGGTAPSEVAKQVARWRAALA